MLQTLSRLFHLVQFVKSWQIVLELNSKGLYQSSRNEKESCCLVFPALINEVGAGGNPGRWSNSPVHIISHFNLITFTC